MNPQTTNTRMDSRALSDRVDYAAALRLANKHRADEHEGGLAGPCDRDCHAEPPRQWDQSAQLHGIAGEGDQSVNGAALEELSLTNGETAAKSQVGIIIGVAKFAAEFLRSLNLRQKRNNV
jgi:hypothetical protein